MLYLVTGTPGSGKTQYSLKKLTQDKHFQDRKIYTWGIPELDPELGWTELEDPEKWDEVVPDGAVIIIDECHTIFPRLKVGNEKLPHYIPLSTHRHRGLDIFLITQYPTDVDIYVRGRVNWHYHLKRKMGMEASVVHKNNEAFDPKDKMDLHRAQTEIYKFDKKIWELYKSATVHNVEKKFPKWLLFAPIGLLVFIGSGWYAVDVLANLGGVEDTPISENVVINTGGPETPRTSPAQTKRALVSYLSQYVPRVEGQPWTAPRYDELMQPARAPKPAGCIHNKHTNVCRCITRDGSPLDVKREFCLGWMSGKYKYFDDTISDDRHNNRPTDDTVLEERS